MNRTVGRRILLSMTCVAAMLLSVDGRANVQEVCGLSPRATAMGNAFSAIADDFSACYYNPAGLAQWHEHRFTLGYLYCKPKLTQSLLSAPDEIHHEETSSYHSVLFGTLVDLTALFDTRGHGLVLGVAATVGEDFKAAWRNHDYRPEVPRFIRHGDYANRAHVFSSLGIEILKDRLFVGAGINFWQDVGTTLRTTMSIDQTLIAKEAEVDGQSEISPIVGLLVKPFSWLNLAYTYRGGWAQNIPVDLVATLALGEFTIPVKVNLETRDYFLPWNMTGGVAVKPLDRLLVSMDVTYYHWSSFELPNWVGLLKEWNNTVIPRVGVQYALLEALMLRAGYYFEPSPVPDQGDVTSNHLDADKHVFSVGVGYGFDRLPWIGELPFRHPIDIDAFFQYQWMQDRTQLKLPSTGQESWRIEGHQIALGVGLSSGF